MFVSLILDALLVHSIIHIDCKGWVKSLLFIFEIDSVKNFCHVRDSDILTVADSVRYCTFFSCQSNGCSIIVGIRNLWFHQLKYRVPERSDLCFTQRLNELDELLFTISKRQEWSTSRSWNCGNCVSYRYQYDVKNRH